MQKIILLFLLVPFLSLAQFYPATVNFSDGKSLTGLAEEPYAGKKLSFKASSKDKKQEFEINDLETVLITYSETQTVTYIATQIYAVKVFKVATEPTPNKVLLGTMYDGGIKIYWIMENTSRHNGRSFTNSTNINYFMKSKSKAYPRMVFIDYGQGTMGEFNFMKKAVAKYVEEECPDFEELLKSQKDNIKANGYKVVGKLYDEHCGK